jgi:glycosyltransferase involved in cell wall biosynthesis
LADSRLKILMLAPTVYFTDRGCLVRIYEEARALSSQGHDVRIVTYHLGRDMPGILTYRIPRIPWYSRLEAGPSWHKLYLDILLFFKAALLIPAFRPHLIHAHLHEGSFIGYFLKKLSGLPLIFDYQGSLTGECIDHGFFGATSRMAALFRFIERTINGFADRIITSSTAGTFELVNTWGVQPERVTPLIDAVDTAVFCPQPHNKGREQLGIPPDSFVVAYLGLMNRYQGTDLLLDCIEQLKQSGSKAFFLIMGFPDERYRAEAQARGLSDLIRFTGKVDYAQAPLLLTAADIAVTPKLSPTEANGKIFNYMACGLPVVAFDTPVNREVLGDTGTYARYGDAQDLAARISALEADRGLTASLAGQVRDRAVSEHSWDSRGKLLSGIYQALLLQHP